MRTGIACWRAVRFALHLLYGLTLAIYCPWLGKTRWRQIVKNWSANLLHIFNVHLNADQAALAELRGTLVVTNHISWLDVFILNAVLPMRFVAKSEVRAWPVVGWLCQRADTLFIERGNARSAARINEQLVTLLRQGDCLTVFPEGTTTDGQQVAHFHASLLQPAVDAAVPVLPLALRYQDRNGELSTAAAYIDDISFGRSLWNIFCAEELHVCIIGTPTLSSENSDRRQLALLAQQQISQALLNASATPPKIEQPIDYIDIFKSVLMALFTFPQQLLRKVCK